MSGNNKLNLALQLKVGEEIPVQPNTRFNLNDPMTIWVVEQEEGDLFLYDLKDEQFLPIFIADIPVGHLMLGKEIASDDKCGFFFISSRHAILRKISIPDFLQAISKDPELKNTFITLFELFINQLISHLPIKEITPEHYLKYDDRLEVPEGAIVGLQRSLIPEEKNKVAWVQLEQGSCNVLDDPSSGLFKESNVIYPLSHLHWLKTTSSATLVSFSTTPALEKKEIWKGIDALQETVFDALVKKKKEEFENALLKLQKKRELEEGLIEQTLLRLGSVLNEDITVSHLHEGDALFQACDRIGESLDVTFKNVSSPELSLEENLAELCGTCNLYFRKVTLKEGWWNSASQPILAFFGDHKPVSIIYRKGKYYEINDPIEKRVRRLTPEIAKQLNETAYVFYSGFPPGKLNILQVAKSLYKFNTRSFAWILFTAIAIGALNLFLPFANQELFNVILIGSEISLLKQFILGLVLTSISIAIFTLCKNFAVQRVDGMSKNQMISASFGRVLQLPASFFRKLSSGDLASRIMSFDRIRTETTSNAINLFVTTIYCIYYVILMFTFNATFTMIGIAGLAISSVIFFTCIAIEVMLTKKSFEIASVIQGLVVQIIAGIGKIRVAGAEGRFFNLWGNLFSQKKKIDLRLQLVTAIERLAYRVFPMVMTSVLFWIAIVSFRKDPAISKALVPSYSLGTFLGFYTAYTLLISSTLEVFQIIFSIYSVMPFWERSKLIVQEDAEMRPEGASKIRLKGAIALDHVYFRYSKESAWTLDDVSIVANPGEMIALVGPSGCGKSTIVRLLLGFEAPEQGEVLFDERDIGDYDIRSIRKQIGTVLQNEGLLGGSIYDNIVGSKTYPIEAIERAIQLSGFDRDLKDLPMGLNTIMSMGGNTISGGQRQRIYLARALVSTPKILIMDEATSALDSESQDRISSNLDQINVTRIVIAHRLSTIRHADRIYVMEAGKIIETGTFKELSEAGGLFTAMLKRQQL